MTKAPLRRGINTLNDEHLDKLTVNQRVGLALVGRAEDRPSWLERIVESFRQTDDRAAPVEFTRKIHQAFALAGHSGSTIFENLWLYTQACDRNTLIWVRSGSGTGFDAASRRVDSTTWFLRLYVTYHVGKQFAEEVLEIEYETWLSVTANGAFAATEAANLLDDATLELELAEDRYQSWVAEARASGVNFPDSLDDLVASGYQELVAEWESVEDS